VRQTVNELLGIEPDAELTKQQKDWCRFFSIGMVVNLPDDKPVEYWVARVKPIKAHLRAGGTLPGVTYLPKRNRFRTSFYSRKTENSQTPDIKLDKLTTPIDPEAEDPYQYLDVLSALSQALGKLQMSTLLHEATEATVLETVNFATPHRRWFSDGVADVVALYAGRRLGKKKAVEEYWQVRTHKHFERWRNRANLRYWLNLDLSTVSPMGSRWSELERERNLDLARYGFAAEEMRRLADEHGIETIAKTIDRLQEQEQVKANDIIDAIDATAGVDMAKRLAQYDAYETQAKAIDAYQTQYIEAKQSGDHKKVISALARLLELRAAELDIRTRINFHRRIATHRLKLGKPQAAAGTFEKLLGAFDDESNKHALRRLWVDWAMHHNRPELAYKPTGKVLDQAPNSPLPLAVRAHQLLEVGRLKQARQLAERLLDRGVFANDPSIRERVQAMANAAATQPAGDG
jgi:tetratricopeptide (TPR) repeat protein